MAIRNTSFELTLGKHENKLRCCLTRPDDKSITLPNFSCSFRQKDVREISTYLTTVIKSARKNTPDPLLDTVTILGGEVGSVLEPILEHFNLIERIEKANMNLTLILDKYTVKIPWELALLRNKKGEIDLNFLCRRINIGRTLKTQNQKKTANTSNAKKGPRERRALVVGLDYTKSKDNDLENCEEDAEKAHKELTAFGKKNKLKVLPLLIGEKVKKSTIEKHLRDGIDIFYFSGHGEIRKNISRIILNRNELLSAQKVDEMLHKFKIKAPRLSFLNACETCLQKPSGGLVKDWAHAIANNGGRALIGTFWSVLDQDSPNFSRAFYRNFFSDGKTIGASVRMAREETENKMEDEDYSTWPAFVLYGNPTLRASDILE